MKNNKDIKRREFITRSVACATGLVVYANLPGCGAAKNAPKNGKNSFDALAQPNSMDKYPIVDFDTCIGCLKCVSKCPTNAIVETGIADEPVQILDEKCIKCGACVQTCPVEAINEHPVPKTLAPEVTPEPTPTPKPHIEPTPTPEPTPEPDPIPSIIADKCKGCGICVRKCPFEAVSMSSDDIAVIDKSKCRGCMICVEKCPFDAIERPKISD